MHKVLLTAAVLPMAAASLLAHGPHLNIVSHPNLGPLPAATTGSFVVYGGYMDTHHSHSSNPKPSPWQGDPGVVFVGRADSASGGWDSSAVRVDNTSGQREQIGVTVDIGSHHYNLWGTQTVQPGEHLILAQTGSDTFDGSDTNPAGAWGADPALCRTSVSSTVPVVHVTVDGATTDVHDTAQLLNTHGVDSSGCPATGGRDDESEQWTRMG